MKLPRNGGRRKLEGRRVGMHRRGKRKNWEAEERSSREIRQRECAREQDGSRLPSLSMVRRGAQGLTIV